MLVASAVPLSSHPLSLVLSSRVLDVLRRQALGVDTLVICGSWTDDCIISTMIRAVAEDFNAVVVEDAIFTCTSVKEEAIAVMKHAYCLMTTADEIAAHWAK